MVEAKIFEKDGYRIGVPSLFGYTEEARRVKRKVNIKTSQNRKKWDELSFFEDVREKLDEREVKGIARLYEYCKSTIWEIRWGSGFIHGSFSLVCPAICPRSIFTVWSNGSMALNFGWLKGDEITEQFRDRMKELVTTRLQFQVPDNYTSKYPAYPVEQWGPKVDSFIGVINDLLLEFTKKAEAHNYDEDS